METNHKPISWIRNLYPDDDDSAEEAEHNFHDFVDFIASLSLDELESIHRILTANKDRANVKE